MGAHFYDTALVNKFKKWIESTQVSLLGPEDTRRLFEIVADKSNDKAIQLPLICIRRIGGYSILQKNKKPLTYDGKMLQSTIERSISLNAIPIDLRYQVDVFTRYYKEADEYMRNIIFNLVNFPMLQVEIPYEGIDIEHDSSVRIVSEVVDNSAINERLSLGQFTRLSLGISIDDAYLFDARVRDNYLIDVKVEACDPNVSQVQVEKMI